MLGSGREVVIVPGNHDHHLLSGWLSRRAAHEQPTAIALEDHVDWADEEPLGRLVAACAPARVRACYPGVWLRDDVYATHGHYLDPRTTMPIFERLGAGAMKRVMRIGELHSVEEYEAVLAPLYAWLWAVCQWRRRVPEIASDEGEVGIWARVNAPNPRGRMARGRRDSFKLGIRALIAALNRAGLGPLRPELTPTALRTSALIAIGQAVGDLGIRADHVVFGHTHRAGPLARDDLGEWLTPSGARLINSGCWVHEPAFLGRDPSRSPYRAGFAVRVEDTGPPELINLLDPA